MLEKNVRYEQPQGKEILMRGLLFKKENEEIYGEITWRF
jgi:hypothetical protein